MIQRIVVLFAIFSGFNAAYGDQAGEFDYYVLALSWNAGFCALEGEEKGAEICDPRHDYGFRLHGLWPQFEDGWPEYCQGVARNPSRSDTAAEADLFGSAGYAWHQWNKHGRCSGLGAEEYYDLSRELFEGFVQPDILMQIDKPLKVDPSVLEAAIIEVNPDYSDENITIACRDGVFYEARICLTKSGAPTSCLGRAAQDCTYSPELLPVR